MQRDWATWLLIGLAFGLGLAFSGCMPDRARADVPGSSGENEPFPLAARSQNAALREELARVVVERGTPAELRNAGRPPEAASSPARRDITADLVALFPASRRTSLCETSRAMMPEGRLLGEPPLAYRRRDFRRRHEAEQNAVRRLLAAGNARIAIDLTPGLAADLAAVEAATLAGRLELCALHEALAFAADAGPNPALPALEHLLHLATLLAQVPHLEARLAAAELRQLAMLGVAAIVQHPRATAETQRQVLARLRQHLQQWPDESGCWQGERAVGLATYELVRQGKLLSLLSLDELHELRARSSVTAHLATVRDQLDDDQLFYLQTLRQILSGCREPYALARPQLERLQRQCRDRAQSPTPAYLATQILLGDFLAARDRQSADRRRCELWTSAVAAALGEEVGPGIDPEYAASFVVVRESTRLVLRDGAETAIVPWPSNRP